MKTYVLTISQVFPSKHPRKGEITGFVNKIARMEKVHTIRDNYELWKYRADEINADRAVLSIRVWSDKPYRSKQREVFVFERIGVQKIERTVLGTFIDDMDSDVTIHELAKNDGLKIEDFRAWFKGAWKPDTPKVIIHFSQFKY